VVSTTIMVERQEEGMYTKYSGWYTTSAKFWQTQKYDIRKYKNYSMLSWLLPASYDITSKATRLLW
jgi:hypothetical protein